MLSQQTLLQMNAKTFATFVCVEAVHLVKANTKANGYYNSVVR